MPLTIEPRLPEVEGVGPVKRGTRTFDTAEYAVIAFWGAGWPAWGRGSVSTMTRRAVLGTEVSIVSEAVKLANCSSRGVRDSNGRRTASGPRLFERRVRPPQ